jgi:hypothetical protein
MLWAKWQQTDVVADPRPVGAGMLCRRPRWPTPQQGVTVAVPTSDTASQRIRSFQSRAKDSRR